MFTLGYMEGVEWVPIFEWVATALSVVAFYFCIQKKASCFLIFIGADLLWLGAAAGMGHYSLVAQQVLFLGMNVIGFGLWRQEEAKPIPPLVGPPWQEMIDDFPEETKRKPESWVEAH